MHLVKQEKQLIDLALRMVARALGSQEISPAKDLNEALFEGGKAAGFRFSQEELFYLRTHVLGYLAQEFYRGTIDQVSLYEIWQRLTQPEDPPPEGGGLAS